MIRSLSLLLTVLVISACTVGPNYRPPPVALGEDYGSGVADDSLVRAEADTALTPWWQQFDDPLLTELITRALTHNHDLEIAFHNLTAARARLGERRTVGQPSGDLNSSASRSLTSEEVSSASRRLENRYNLALDISWELDVFGRIRRLVESAEASAQASAADWQAMQLMIVADVASQYMSLRGLQSRQQVAIENAEIQQQTLELTQALNDAGRGNELDVQLARAQLALTRSSLPQLRADAQAAIHRLSVLTGQLPTTLNDELTENKPLPTPPQRIVLASPLTLLSRRPDVRAEERRLAATIADIGVATANLYPRIDLAGLIGLAARSSANLLDASAQAASATLGVSWPVLNLKANKLLTDIERAEADAQHARYQRAVLLAVEETETALIQYIEQRQTMQSLQVAEQASREAARLARARFQAGASDFLTVLDAESRRLEATDRRVQSRIDLSRSVVTLYRALGGDWSEDSGFVADEG